MAMLPSKLSTVAFLLTVGASKILAFSPGNRGPLAMTARMTRPSTSARHLSAFEPSEILTEECIITPEGYGFSAPMKRISKEAKRGDGFYRAAASDKVVDVMQAITEGNKDVALVYEGPELLGIFTEADYIRVRRSSTVCYATTFHP